MSYAQTKTQQVEKSTSKTEKSLPKESIPETTRDVSIEKFTYCQFYHLSYPQCVVLEGIHTSVRGFPVQMPLQCSKRSLMTPFPPSPKIFYFFFYLNPHPWENPIANTNLTLFLTKEKELNLNLSN